MFGFLSRLQGFLDVPTTAKTAATNCKTSPFQWRFMIKTSTPQDAKTKCIFHSCRRQSHCNFSRITTSPVHQQGSYICAVQSNCLLVFLSTHILQGFDYLMECIIEMYIDYGLLVFNTDIKWVSFKYHIRITKCLN